MTDSTCRSPALLARFESCGDNCEFGLLQRTFGVERLGLLRYAGVGNVARLSAAIERRFEGFAAASSLRAFPGETGWMVSVADHDMIFHTGRSPSEIGEAAIIGEAGRLLRFAAEKFLEDCASGERIFVFRTPRERSCEAEMLRLHDAMRGAGAARLLWVTRARGETPGSVRPVRQDLAVGFIARFLTPQDDYAAQTARWLDLLEMAVAVLERPG